MASENYKKLYLKNRKTKTSTWMRRTDRQTRDGHKDGQAIERASDRY